MAKETVGRDNQTEEILSMDCSEQNECNVMNRNILCPHSISMSIKKMTVHMDAENDPQDMQTFRPLSLKEMMRKAFL